MDLIKRQRKKHLTKCKATESFVVFFIKNENRNCVLYSFKNIGKYFLVLCPNVVFYLLQTGEQTNARSTQYKTKQ